MHRLPARPGSPVVIRAPRGALNTVWIVVNLVNLLQAVGFATRVIDQNLNRILGAGIIILGIPAGLALVRFVRAGSGWRLYAGPVSFMTFVVASFAIDYLLELEFRSPRRPEILVPYLVLFFGSIVLMGAPMARLSRRRWGVTVITASILLGAMGFAMARGVA